MKNLNWFQARDIAQKQSRAIRREAWRQWLYYTPWYLWFIAQTDAQGAQQRRVVVNGDFGAAEFLASDWTDEPWPDANDGVNGTSSSSSGDSGSAGSGAAGSTNGTGNNGTTSGTAGTGTSGSGTSAGNSSSGGTASWGTGSLSDSTTPDSSAPAVWIITSGGLPSGPPTSVPPPQHNPPQNQPPTVSVSVDYITLDDFDEGNQCFDRNSGGNYSGSFTVTVTISGGPAGIGTFDVRIGTKTPQLGTAWDGFNRSFEFDNIPFLPGGSLTANASYSINGQTYTGSGSFSIPDYCQPDYTSH